MASRIHEVVEDNNLNANYSIEDIKWISKIRNNIVHNKRLGSFEVKKRSVTYKSIEKQQTLDRETTNKFINVASKTMSELYLSSCKCMGINRRFKQHKMNTEVLEILIDAF